MKTGKGEFAAMEKLRGTYGTTTEKIPALPD
jgi:hypothetical protein